MRPFTALGFAVPPLRPGLRVPRHRATTRNLVALYPWVAEAGLGGAGVQLGLNVTAGNDAFHFDPFQLYTDDHLQGPNMVVCGMVGCGKSATLKAFLWRSVGMFGSPPAGGPRWVAIFDPKGEYGPLGEALGLDVVRLRPGGGCRVNPLDRGPGDARTAGDLARLRTDLVLAMAGHVLPRPLQPIEDAAVGYCIDLLTSEEHAEPTLLDLTAMLGDPPASVAARTGLRPDDLVDRLADIRLSLGKLLDRNLRGMFDGRSTVTPNWNGRGIVIDLSAVFHDRDALPLVMLAATSWLQALYSPTGSDGPRRYQVLDEAWAVLGTERTARFVQSTWKLSRHYGIVNIAVVHRISDLRSQADDGTAAAKVAEGLLADSQTRVVFRQSSDQVEDATRLLGLSPVEADLLPQLVRGRALWKIGGHSAVVQHVLGDHERQLCRTDQRLALA